jgi:hypothetical protein
LKEQLKPMLKPALKEELKSVQKMAQKTILKQAQKLTSKQIMKIVTPKITTMKIPPKKIREISARKKATELGRQIFEAVGKRYGEEFSLGKYPTQYGAEKKFKQFAKGTLGASGRILKAGKPLEFEELKFIGGAEFKPAKRDITRIVQQPSFRLGTGQEVSEILIAKRKSKSKKMRWI